MLPVVVAGPQANTLLSRLSHLWAVDYRSSHRGPTLLPDHFPIWRGAGGLFGVMFGTLIDVGGISTTRQVLALIDMSFHLSRKPVRSS